ncbi:MAG: phospho-sugar mutase [Spirochaetes bacterium]|nr:phospho-sugar mutase [Spirochaetota bacterium]
MDKKIKILIDEWTKPPFDGITISEIRSLLDKNDEKELTERFYANLEFGTGGLRGIIGAGTNRMNIYTVGMAAQGLANYITGKKRMSDGVVIACDSRRMSDVFSREAASILAGNGIKVYLFDDITPTPICSFAIRELKTVSGIVITASHNPPEYNGFKVYWDDGGQVIPPHDKAIIAEVNKIGSISQIKKIDFNRGISKGIIQIIGDGIRKSYISKLEETALRKKGKSDAKIVYTPLHGTGYKIIPEMLSYFGFGDVHSVKEQAKPDGNFPTVKYPNPEEKEALTMAVKLAREINADIIMATDPDADRMGIGFKDKTGGYILINGNQIGTMLEYYLLKRLKEENKLPENSSIVKTIVTTDLQNEIARSFNCNVDDVLTGFKWIAEKMKEYDDKGSRKFIFGGEESYGYLPVNFVRDKDAVSACYFFAEMADWLKSNGSSLYEFLLEIYLKYNLYVEDLHSLTLKGMDGMEKINKIMKSFRNRPPNEFAGINIKKINDIETLKSTDMSSKKEESIKGLPESNVIQYFLDDGSKITMRPSGTEPKIKFYFSVNKKVLKDNFDKIESELRQKIDGFKKDLVAKVDKL